MSIYVFEQDCIHKDEDDNVTLNEAYIDEYFSYRDDYDEFTTHLEVSEDNLTIYQVFNGEGESWKFVQAHYLAPIG